MADKRIGRDCQQPECGKTVEDGPLYRVNPRGEKGIFMCEEDARFVNHWENRIKPNTPSPEAENPK